MSELVSATDAGKVQWHEGASEAYYCNHKQYALHIAPHFDGETGESSYVFRLVNDGRNTVFIVTYYEDDYSTMRDLYSSVLANANNVSVDLEGFFDSE